MSLLDPGKSNPAASFRSVGGINAWAVRRCGKYDRLRLSGGGKMNPSALSNGSSATAANREFHIRFGKNAVLMTIGVRRWLRGPRRPGPTTLLFSMPIAMDCVSPKPLVGE